MTNYGIKIDLLKLQGSFVTNIKGRTMTKRCLVVPIDDARLYLGEKGCYLDLAAIELQNQQYSDTHCIKQQLPKEEYEALSEEERRAMPILGGLREIERKQQSMTVNGNVDVSQDDSDVPF
jgi:hypothetical protein